MKVQTGAEIHFLCKAAFAQTVRNNPFIDRIWTIDQHVKEVAPALRKEGFDAVIDLHNNLRTKHLQLLLRNRFYAFPKLNLQKWLLCRFGIDRMPKELHLVDRYFKAVEPLGVQNDGLGLDYYFSSGVNRLSADASNSTLLAALPKTYIAWVLGATHPTKRLPSTKINRVLKQLNHPVVLLGGKDVEQEALGIKSHENGQLINLVGKIKLEDSVAVMAKSALVVSPDTGLMHIAAALEKPMVTVWGNTVPAFGMTPYYSSPIVKHHLLEVPNLPCRPCSKIGYMECPKKHFACMEKQDENKLLKAIQDCLVP
ncbi:MAG: glycosyltransferase family 9 protein [Bacteroidota bacterium]